MYTIYTIDIHHSDTQLISSTTKNMNGMVQYCMTGSGSVFIAIVLRSKTTVAQSMVSFQEIILLFLTQSMVAHSTIFIAIVLYHTFCFIFW